MYVTAHDNFYQAFPRVSSTSDKYWGGKAWVEAIYMYVNCKHVVSVYSLVTPVVSLLIFVAAVQESYQHLPIVWPVHFGTSTISPAHILPTQLEKVLIQKGILDSLFKFC